MRHWQTDISIQFDWTVDADQVYIYILCVVRYVKLKFNFGLRI